MHWFKVHSSLLLVACLGSLACGQEELLNPSSVIMVQADVQSLQVTPAVAKTLGESEVVTPWLQVAQNYLAKLKQSAEDERLILAVDLPFRTQLSARMGVATGPGDRESLSELAALVWPGAVGAAKREGQFLVVPLSDTPAGLKDLPELGTLSESELATWQAALNATGDNSLTIAFVLPEYVQEVMAELLPSSRPVGDRWNIGLLRKLRWFSLGVDAETLAGKIVIQTVDSAAAKSLMTDLPELFDQLLAQLPETDEPVAAADLVAQLTMTQEDDQFILSWSEAQAAAILATLLKTTEAVSKPIATQQAMRKMQQMVLGMHNHYSALRALPTYVDLAEHGESQLSWRVHILPYIEQAELYQRFHLDEPWDSPHNIQLLDEMPSVFESVHEVGASKPELGHTVFVAPVGKDTLFGRSEVIGFENVVDGTSNTIVVVELAPEHAVPWTAPEEYRFDEGNPAAKLVDRAGVTLGGFLDGRISQLSLPKPPKTWNALFSISDGEIVRLE